MHSALIFLATLALAFAAPKSFNIRNAPDDRIIGGQDADITAYPHQISLEWITVHYCGGSIISEIYVITAAHCTNGSQAHEFKVRVGTNTIGSGGVLIGVQTIHQHPNFNLDSIDFDISILELAEPLVFSDSIQPIGLPNGQAADGIEVAVTGWGVTVEGGSSLSAILQVVFVNIVNIDECRAAYSGGTITENMLCAGVPEGGKDSCLGDSGGPLIADGTLYGIVSWGYGCARPGFPGVYSNVASLREYINEITGL